MFLLFPQVLSLSKKFFHEFWNTCEHKVLYKLLILLYDENMSGYIVLASYSDLNSIHSSPKHIAIHWISTWFFYNFYVTVFWTGNGQYIDYIAPLYLERGSSWGGRNREMESTIYFLKLFLLTNCLWVVFSTPNYINITFLFLTRHFSVLKTPSFYQSAHEQ